MYPEVLVPGNGENEAKAIIAGSYHVYLAAADPFVSKSGWVWFIYNNFYTSRVLLCGMLPGDIIPVLLVKY